MLGHALTFNTNTGNGLMTSVVAYYPTALSCETARVSFDHLLSILFPLLTSAGQVYSRCVIHAIT